MSGKVKKVTITGAALLAMGMTGPSVAAAESADGESEQAPAMHEAALPPAAAPANDDRAASAGRSGAPRRD